MGGEGGESMVLFATTVRRSIEAAVGENMT